MDATSRRNFLKAADSLLAISFRRGPEGDLRCDFCTQHLGHSDYCPVHRALKALLPLLPPKDSEESWIESGEPWPKKDLDQ